MEFPVFAGLREGKPLTVSVSRSPLRALSIGLAAVSALALGGCMGSPTYGTDKTANAQLVQDLSGILSIGPGSSRRNEIEYQPRPDLVKPQTMAVLPSPQDSVTASTSAGWPESPEQRLRRIRAEATANQNNPTYRSPVVNDIAANGEQMTPGQQREAFRAGRREMAGDADSRRYLSEPPLDYRVPAATAPVGELGMTEDRKERQAKRDARKNRRNADRAIGETPLTE